MISPANKWGKGEFVYDTEKNEIWQNSMTLYWKEWSY